MVKEKFMAQAQPTEEVKRMVKNLEELGGTLMLIGLTCLFLYFTMVGGVGIPAFTMIIGAGCIFVVKIVRALVPNA
jgi:uncharacterized membrane protein